MKLKRQGRLYDQIHSYNSCSPLVLESHDAQMHAGNSAGMWITQH